MAEGVAPPVAARQSRFSPAERSIIFGVLLAAFFGALEHALFYRSQPQCSEWRLRAAASDGCLDCYPHPSNDSLCGKPFACRRDRLIGDRLIGDRLVGDRLIGDRLVGDRLIGDRLIGDKLIAAPKDDFAFVISADGSDLARVLTLADRVAIDYNKRLIALVDGALQAENCGAIISGSLKLCCVDASNHKAFNYFTALEEVLRDVESLLFFREPTITLNHIGKGDVIAAIRSKRKDVVTIGGSAFATQHSLAFTDFFPGRMPKEAVAFDAIYVNRNGWKRLQWAQRYLESATSDDDDDDDDERTALQIVAKIAADYDFAHIDRPDALSGPVPVLSVRTVFRACYLAVAFFVVFVTFIWEYAAEHFEERA